MATRQRRPNTETAGFHTNATTILNSVWSELEAIDIAQLPTGSVSEQAYLILENTEIAWKYALINQVVGKAADFSLDALCLQKGDGGPGLWDAREFAKSVFVPWHKSIGSPIGTSGDPYVSNTLRHRRLDDQMRQARRTPAMFDVLKGILDQVQDAESPEQVRQFLLQILAQLRRYMAGKTFHYPIPQRVSVLDTLGCVREYLEESSGGARLQAIAHGLVLSLKEKGLKYEDIQSRHVNAADAASQSAGDIECFADGANVFTVEVKDRALTLSELDSSIEKARLASVTELLFFVYRKDGAPYSDAESEQINATISRQFSLGLNIYIVSGDEFLRLCCSLLGEDGRKVFLESVGSALAVQGADPKHRWAWSQAVRTIGSLGAN